MNKPSLIAAVGATAVLAAGTLLVDTKSELDVSVHDTVNAFDAMNPHNRHLLHTAAGALIFRRITKAGAGVAGEHGQGALRVGGKTVGHYSVSAAFFGFTLAASQRSEILVFTMPEAWIQFTSS